MNYEGRLDRLAGRLGGEGLDALLVTSLVNVRYGCGYVGSNGVLLLAGDRRLLLTDFRYVAAARAQTSGVEVVEAGRDLLDRVGAAIVDAGGGRVGIEAEHMSVARLQELRDRLPDVDWAPTRGLVEDVRVIKDAQEIACMAAASLAADAAFAACRDGLFAGRTERQVAWELEGLMRARGAEGASFSIIVASGPRGALPHAVPADVTIPRDTLVTVDMGARVEGYASDCTRTFATGTLPDDLARAYDVCLTAQMAAVAAIRPGITGGELDAAARQVVADAGFGDDFKHGVGHGVGLDIHERPWARQGVEQVIEAGMTVTVEPGIYLEGRGGVRIEDLVVVTDDGCQVLTGFTKELLQVDS